MVTIQTVTFRAERGKQRRLVIIEECVPNSELVEHERDHCVAVIGQSTGPRKRDAPALWDNPLLPLSTQMTCTSGWPNRVSRSRCTKKMLVSAQEIRFLLSLRCARRRVVSSFGIRTSKHAAFLRAGPTLPGPIVLVEDQDNRAVEYGILLFRG